MSLIDVTPKMTSNATPVPYKVSASSEWTPSYATWKAFTGVDNVVFSEGNLWISNYNVFPCWICIDFNKQTKINSFSINRNIYSNGTAAHVPGDFSLEGSNNSIDWVALKDISESYASWNQSSKKFYQLNKNVNYRYYRIYIKTGIKGNIIDNGTKVQLSNIKFYYDDELLYNPSEKIKQLIYDTIKPSIDKCSTLFEIEG